MTIKYYNGYGTGVFVTNEIDLILNSTQAQTRKFFRQIVGRAWDSADVAAQIAAEVFDLLSYLRTQLDIIKAAPTARKKDITMTQTAIKRLELAQRLCEEV